MPRSCQGCATPTTPGYGGPGVASVGPAYHLKFFTFIGVPSRGIHLSHNPQHGHQIPLCITLLLQHHSARGVVLHLFGQLGNTEPPLKMLAPFSLFKFNQPEGFSGVEMS